MFKLHKNYFLQAMLFIVAVVGMNSCSCNSKESVEDKITYLVPDDVDLVVTGDVSRTLSALEISVEDGKLVLPDYLTEFISVNVGRSEAREIEDGLDMVKGIDYTNTVLAVRFSGEEPDMVYAFNVTDEEELYKTVLEIDEEAYLDESGDYKVITNGEDKAVLVIKDGLAAFVSKHGRPLEAEDAVEMLEKWIAKADESPLADWKKDYLTQPAVMNLWYNFGMLQEIEPGAFREMQEAIDAQGADINFAEMSFGIRFDLAGSSAKANITAFDGTGAEFKNPYAGTFDSALLDYAIPTDYAAASIAINDKAIKTLVNAYKKATDEYIRDLRDESYYYDEEWAEQRARELAEVRDKVTGIAESFDGNAMVAFGTAPGVTLSGINLTDPNSYHFVAAVKCKPGKTQEVFNLICQVTDEACAGQDTTAVMDEPGAPVASNYGDSYHNSMRSFNGYDENYEPTYVNLDLYAKIEGNTIIYSNAPISRKGGSNFDRNVFASNASAVQIKIDKDSPLVSSFDLPCGVEATATGSSSFDFDITFSGTDQNFVPALFKIISGLN